MIQNGTLLRKLQSFAANKAVKKIADLDKWKTSIPGPGTYSPGKAEKELTGKDPYKEQLTARLGLSPQNSNLIQMSLGTIRSATNNSSLNNKSLFLAKTRTVELTFKKTLGKNPPPKLKLRKLKAVPSIPANSEAPPDDKSKLMSYTSELFDQNYPL